MPALDPVQFVNASLTYDMDGNIRPTNNDPLVAEQLNRVLGLNERPVLRGRERMLNEVKQQLDSVPDREAERQALLRKLDPDQPSNLPLLEYADYLLFHLRDGELTS